MQIIYCPKPILLSNSDVETCYKEHASVLISSQQNYFLLQPTFWILGQLSLMPYPLSSFLISNKVKFCSTKQTSIGLEDFWPIFFWRRCIHHTKTLWSRWCCHLSCVDSLEEEKVTLGRGIIRLNKREKNFD